MLAVGQTQRLHSVSKRMKQKPENQLGRWWCTPLIPALGRQRQEDLREFETSLVYRASSRTGSKAKRNPVSKNKTNKQKKKPENQ